MTTETGIDDRDVYEIRHQKLADLRAQGFDFPNHFRRSHQAADIMLHYGTGSSRAH